MFYNEVSTYVWPYSVAFSFKLAQKIEKCESRKGKRAERERQDGRGKIGGDLIFLRSRKLLF